MSALPPFVTRDLVAERLPLIFPEGIRNRTYCVRELAASTVFTALYIGAVDGNGRYLGPVHVYRMTEQQAAQADASARDAYAEGVLRRNFETPGKRWYADNTREPIRDETLREGLVAVGAILCRDDLPTTSGKPRYSLRVEFAALFDPLLAGSALETAVAAFQTKHLSKSALARVSIMLSGAVGAKSAVKVTLPNGDTRLLAPGPSSIIAKAVVEDFCVRFLEAPALLWLSESGNKVVSQDDRLAARIGLKIEPDKNLPDLILADLGPDEPLLVFVEVVATDGAVTDLRQQAMHALTDAAGFPRNHVAFVTAYQDRQSAGFKKTVAALAWGSFAWFVSEPNSIVHMRDGSANSVKLGSLIAT